MCSSMKDENPQPTKPHKLNSEVPTDHANPSKLVNNFLFKATIFTVFLVILPLLPSILPEFINLNFHPRIWELLQLVCVGIAVSYGLFSKKNEGVGDKEPHHYSLFDNANSYISRLLQVSSVFDDEVENPSSSSASSDENKLQSWSSQYYREEPIVMVANESPSLEQETATSLRIEEKPLLLPVRSLKSRVSEPNAAETSSLLNRSDSNNSSSDRFAGKSVKGDAMRLSPQKMEEKTVHPSPIPWRSRSGRMEMKSDEDSPLMEDSETQFKRSRLSRSFKLNSTTSSSSPPTRSSRFSSESKGEIVDDGLRRKMHKPISSSPPPPPPPPPASFLHNNKPLQLKSNSGLSQNNDFFEMNLRNSVKSVKTDSSSRSQSGKANSGSELRAKAKVNDIPPLQAPIIRPKWKDLEEKVRDREMEGPFMEKRGSMDNNKLMPEIKKESLMEYPKEDKKGFNETVVVETDMGSESESESESEEDDFERSIGNSESAYDKEEEEEEAANENGTTDEGPDVDKKADEFIAKFREQIRLQRTESIRSSATDHHSRNRSR